MVKEWMGGHLPRPKETFMRGREGGHGDLKYLGSGGASMAHETVTVGHLSSEVIG